MERKKHYNMRTTHALPLTIITYLSAQQPALLPRLLTRKLTAEEIQGVPLEQRLPILLYLKDIHLTQSEKLPHILQELLAQELTGTITQEYLQRYEYMSQRWQQLALDRQITPETKKLVESWTARQLSALLMGELTVGQLEILLQREQQDTEEIDDQSSMSISLPGDPDIEDSSQKKFRQLLPQMIELLPFLLKVADPAETQRVREQWQTLYTSSTDMLDNVTFRRVRHLTPPLLRKLLTKEISPEHTAFTRFLTGRDSWSLLLWMRSPQERERVQTLASKIEQQYPVTWRNLWHYLVEQQPCQASTLQSLLLERIPYHDYPPLFFWQYAQQKGVSRGEGEKREEALDDIWNLVKALPPDLAADDLTTPEEILHDLLTTQIFNEAQRAVLTYLADPEQQKVASLQQRFHKPQKAWRQQLARLATLDNLPIETRARLYDLKNERPEVLDHLQRGKIKLSRIARYLHPQDLYPILRLLLPKPLVLLTSNFALQTNILEQVHLFAHEVDALRNPCLGYGHYHIPIYKVDTEESTLAICHTKVAWLETTLLAYHDLSRSFVVTADQLHNLYLPASGYHQTLGRTVVRIALTEPGSGLRINPLAFIPTVDEAHCPPDELYWRLKAQREMAVTIARTWVENTPERRQQKTNAIDRETDIDPIDVKDLIMAGLMHLREADIDNPRQLYHLAHLLKDVETFLRIVKASNASQAREIASRLEQQGQQLQEELLRQSITTIEMLADPAVRALTAGNDIDFTYLLRHPTICFIDVPSEKQEYLKPIVAIIHCIMEQQLTQEVRTVRRKNKELEQRQALQKVIHIVVEHETETDEQKKEEHWNVWHRDVTEQTFLLLTSRLAGVERTVLRQVGQIIARDLSQEDSDQLSNFLGAPVSIEAGKTAYFCKGKLLIAEQQESFPFSPS